MISAGAIRYPQNSLARLRLSRQRRRHHMITGRMDFCMDERGLKSMNTMLPIPHHAIPGGINSRKWAEQGYTGKGITRRRA